MVTGYHTKTRFGKPSTCLPRSTNYLTPPGTKFLRSPKASPGSTSGSVRPHENSLVSSRGFPSTPMAGVAPRPSRRCWRRAGTIFIIGTLLCIPGGSLSTRVGARQPRRRLRCCVRKRPDHVPSGRNHSLCLGRMASSWPNAFSSGVSRSCSSGKCHSFL